MVAVLVKLVMQTHRAPLPLNSVESEVEAVDAGAVHIVHIVHILHLLPQNQFWQNCGITNRETRDEDGDGNAV